MNFKKSLLIVLFSFGVAHTALAETDQEKFDRAYQYIEQQNYSAAFPLFKQLAEQGDKASQLNIGSMYSRGEGVAQSDSQAVYWWKKATEQGLAQAQFKLGGAYFLGKGIPKDYSKAYYLFNKAAEQQYSNAYVMLGFLYKEGWGIRRDLSKAKQYYGLACDAGIREGCENYAELDKKGIK